MKSFQEMLEKYAQLTIKVGVNLQKGQKLMIISDVAAADFVHVVAKHAYTEGARDVYIEWQDEQFNLIKYQQAPEEAFREYPSWYGDARADLAKQGAAFLVLLAETPDLMNEIDPGKIAELTRARTQTVMEFRNYTRFNKVSWCIAAVPNRKWAEQIFPQKQAEEALEAFWDVLFKINRIDQKDPVAAWEAHLNRLGGIKHYLNGKKYKKLHYKAPGTELTVVLPERHLWVAAESDNEQGVRFVPNLPTEEVFTSPHKSGTTGVVSSTKPLHYQGTIIDRFSLRLENGAVVEVKAEKGEETLKKLIDTDEGSVYLGEIALVPHHSPISQTNLLFHNTLFDENASCHLAIGMAFPFCLEGGTKMSKEALADNGLNMSQVHVDFMIGGAEMSIAAETADGKREALFEKGNWAINLESGIEEA